MLLERERRHRHRLLSPMMERKLTFSNRRPGRLLNANDGQRKSYFQFAIETNLDMVNTILLKLHAAKDVNVRDIRVQRRKSEP